jgi:hypothetical protein
MNLTRRQFSLIAGAAVNRLRAEDLRMVKARRKPNDEWTRISDAYAGPRHWVSASSRGPKN